jgi:hypothetical protein
MVFVYLQRWKDQDESDESENEYELQVNPSEEFPHIMRSDAKTIFQVCSKANDFTFLNAFLYNLTFELHRGTESENMIDPRERDEEDTIDRCAFHCHKKSVDCRPCQDDQAGGYSYEMKSIEQCMFLDE